MLGRLREAHRFTAWVEIVEVRWREAPWSQGHIGAPGSSYPPKERVPLALTGQFEPNATD